MLYMPGVIRADGMYKMWYVGTSGPPRPANCHLGYATSTGRHTLGGVSQQSHHHR